MTFPNTRAADGGTLEYAHDVSEILLSRPAKGRTDRRRSYKIFIDREHRVTLRHGEDAKVSVAAGAHTVQARIDWCRSRRVDLDLGDQQRAVLLCQSGIKSPLLGLLYATLWSGRYIDLQLIRVEST